MTMLPILYLIILFTARNNTAYHPKLLFRKCFEISNPTIARILIRQSDPLIYRGKNRPEYRNKITLIGIVLYIISVATIIFHIIILNTRFLGPAKSYNDGGFIGFRADTINQAIVVTSSWLLLAINVFVMFFNMLTIAILQKDIYGRKITIGIGAFFCVFFLFFIGLEISELIGLIV